MVLDERDDMPGDGVAISPHVVLIVGHAKDLIFRRSVSTAGGKGNRARAETGLLAIPRALKAAFAGNFLLFLVPACLLVSGSTRP